MVGKMEADSKDVNTSLSPVAKVTCIQGIVPLSKELLMSTPQVWLTSWLSGLIMENREEYSQIFPSRLSPRVGWEEGAWEERNYKRTRSTFSHPFQIQIPLSLWRSLSVLTFKIFFSAHASVLLRGSIFNWKKQNMISKNAIRSILGFHPPDHYITH